MSRSELIGVIDCGMGNVRSVVNAFTTIGCDVSLLREPGGLERTTHVVLPGVGAFPDCMAKLRNEGWEEALQGAVLVEGRPFLGICLGMQVLCTLGTEHEPTAGLGWVPGTVVRLPEQRDLRIPHVGWNDLQEQERCRLFDGLPQNVDFYFVHSFAAVPDSPAHVAAACQYGDSFVAAVHRGNVHGVQFHPEKSHRAGLTLISNFVHRAATSC